MACYTPLSGFYSGRRTKNGKPEIIVGKRQLSDGAEMLIPCGQCIGCRLERSRQWAVRCVHEASLHTSNCFITLTYSPENLPADGSLDLRHFQLFMKRLRKKFGKVRFFHCGEYGDRLGRPHYHALLFGFDFPDKSLFSERGGNSLFTSRLLDDLWGLGLCVIGDLNFDTAAYCARYVTKKVNGKLADEHYLDRVTGVVRKAEYCTMSRRPGIGSEWFEKFSSDVFPKDNFHLNGMELRPPKFYDRKFELLDVEAMFSVKERRIAGCNTVDNLSRRLKPRLACALARAKQFKRSYEDG